MYPIVDNGAFLKVVLIVYFIVKATLNPNVKIGVYFLDAISIVFVAVLSFI
jgi:hypothetical protein